VEAGSNTSTVTLRAAGGDEKGSLQYETVKSGRESQGTRTRDRLRWQEPAAYTKDRPTLSSERAPHKNGDVTVKHLVISTRWGSTPKLTDWLTVSRNVTLILTLNRRRQKRKSQIWDSKILSRVLRDSDPKMTALARSNSNCKQKTRPLVRENVTEGL
jgi:hypothetical protein